MSQSFRLAPLALALAVVSVLSLSTVANAAPPADGVININTATVDQLSFLPGIGEAKAERIVALRTTRPFKRVVDLARVRGIGLRTVRKLKPWLRTSGKTTVVGPIRRGKPMRGSQEGLSTTTP